MILAFTTVPFIIALQYFLLHEVLKTILQANLT